MWKSTQKVHSAHWSHRYRKWVKLGITKQHVEHFLFHCLLSLEILWLWSEKEGFKYSGRTDRLCILRMVQVLQLSVLCSWVSLNFFEINVFLRWFEDKNEIICEVWFINLKTLHSFIVCCNYSCYCNYAGINSAVFNFKHINISV